MDLNECKNKGFIKITTINKSKALSLIEISDIKEDTIKHIKLDSKNINAYFPMAYDSLREVLEAFCLLRGFNVTNHICLGELIKDLKKDFDFISFDRFRYARNGINYYGSKIDFDQGKEMINKMFEMKKLIKKEIK